MAEFITDKDGRAEVAIPARAGLYTVRVDGHIIGRVRMFPTSADHAFLRASVEAPDA